MRILDKHRPHEIYNLAWQSHVGLSFKIPEVSNRDYEGFVNLITAVESLGWYGPERYSETVRIYQASTSEMFGDRDESIGGMDESVQFAPNSPYAIAKTAAHYYAQMKRKQGMFISCGILFNHESEIRGGDFVTQKIARGVANWQKTGEPIKLGNLEAKRDWGYAGDYVKAMALMLQQDDPGDYVVGTGYEHTVREFVEAAFKAIGQTVEWDQAVHGFASKHDVGVVNGKIAVEVVEEFYRPNDVGFLKAEPAKIEAIGWEPEHDFESLVKLMVEEARK